MKTILPLALLLWAVLLPGPVQGQGLALGARAGSLGLGGEAAYGLSETLTVRGGFGVFPFEYDGEFEEEEYTVSLPTSIWSVGLDLYPGGGPIRLMGGFIGRSGDIEVESTFSGEREIGDTEYTSSGTLLGTLDQGSVAPFLGLGFGRHTGGGFGFFLDLGVAFTGEPDVTITPSGPIASEPGIQEALREEENTIQDEAGAYLEYWPILSLGIKVPLGG